MPACPVCGYENAAGALVCAHCHTALVEPETSHDESATQPCLPLQQPADVPPRRPVEDLGSPGADDITLYIEGVEEPLILQITHQATLGRRTPGAAVQPRVDLTPYSAVEKGVSRLHTVIRRMDTGLTVEDLASTNGTWLNGVPLPPYTPRLLHSGDRLTLGRLEIAVYFR